MKKARLTLAAVAAAVSFTNILHAQWSTTWPGPTPANWGPSGRSNPALVKPTPWALGGNDIIANTPDPNYRTESIGTIGDNIFALKSNNKETIFLTQGTNVGIGLNNSYPATVLDIWSAANPASSSSRLKFYVDGAGNIESDKSISLNVANNFYVNAGPVGSSTQRLILTNGGSMGINNPSPAAALDVRNAAANNQSSTRIFGDNMGTIQSTSHMNMVCAGDFIISQGTAFNNPVDHFTIHNGNVGIDEPMPAEKLQVNGNTRIIGNLGVGAYPALEKLHIAGGNARIDGHVGIGGPPTSETVKVQDPSAAHLKVATFSQNLATLSVENAVGGYAFGIDGTADHIGHISSGSYNIINFQSYFSPTVWPPYPQVWIGGKPTSNHQDFLFAVNGKMVAKSLYLTLNCAWADYVFEPDYKLAKLEDVESYYKANKHLPEIPTAKDVEANGIGVAEMNVLLLKKVEELTLYVVEQQKEINKLKESRSEK